MMTITDLIHIRSAYDNYYVYDLFHRSLHISNPIIYQVAAFCRINKKEISQLTLDEKKWITASLHIPLRQLEQALRLYQRQYPISSLMQFSPIDFHPITLKQIWESVANVPQVTIELTEKCNLACSYCCYRDIYASETESTRCKDINLDLCLKTLETIIRLHKSKLSCSVGQEFIISFYGGEPLLNFKAIEAIVHFSLQFCTENFKIKYRMTTNGILLDKYLSFLVQYNFRLAISLDGDEYSDSYRVFPDGSLSFPVVYRNIVYIREQYPDFFDENVFFLSVLHNRNSVNSISDFFEQFGKTANISQVSQEGIKDEKLFEEITKVPESSKNQVNQLYFDPAVFHTFLKSYVVSDVNYLDLFKKIIFNKQASVKVCHLFAVKLFLTATGEIHICEKSAWKFPFGKATSKGIHFYVDKINGYYRNLFELVNRNCLDCYDIKNCKRCYFSSPSQLFKGEGCKITYDQLVQRITALINESERIEMLSNEVVDR